MAKFPTRPLTQKVAGPQRAAADAGKKLATRKANIAVSGQTGDAVTQDALDNVKRSIPRPKPR